MTSDNPASRITAQAKRELLGAAVILPGMIFVILMALLVMVFGPTWVSVAMMVTGLSLVGITIALDHLWNGSNAEEDKLVRGVMSRIFIVAGATAALGAMGAFFSFIENASPRQNNYDLPRDIRNAGELSRTLPLLARSLPLVERTEITQAAAREGAIPQDMLVAAGVPLDSTMATSWNSPIKIYLKQDDQGGVIQVSYLNANTNEDDQLSIEQCLFFLQGAGRYYDTVGTEQNDSSIKKSTLPVDKKAAAEVCASDKPTTLFFGKRFLKPTANALDVWADTSPKELP